MIIGITGHKQNGKDTIAKYLINKHEFIQFSFAEPLKEISKILFGFTDEQVNGDKKEIIDDFWHLTPRSVLQFMGTEMFRNQISSLIPDIGHDFWIKILEKKILSLSPNYRNIVISDVRFPNEVEFIKKYNGIMINVFRNNLISIDNHPSEQLIDTLKVDYYIPNNGSINELYKVIEKVLFV